MLFYILLFMPIIAFVILSVFVGLASNCSHWKQKVEDGVNAGLMSAFIGLAGSLIAAFCWSEHSDDVSKVVAQQHRIAVFEERIESLNKRLTEFNYPAKSEISLDADSPWASMVNSLTEAETQLAQAKDERAVAIRSIEARKRGPMSGVVSFVGDYE